MSTRGASAALADQQLVQALKDTEERVVPWTCAKDAFADVRNEFYGAVWQRAHGAMGSRVYVDEASLVANVEVALLAFGGDRVP